MLEKMGWDSGQRNDCQFEKYFKILNIYFRLLNRLDMLTPGPISQRTMLDIYCYASLGLVQ